MINEYASKIESIFYLIENQDLTQEERLSKIKNCLSELKEETRKNAYKKAVNDCKNALNNL